MRESKGRNWHVARRTGAAAWTAFLVTTFAAIGHGAARGQDGKPAPVDRPTIEIPNPPTSEMQPRVRARVEQVRAAILEDPKSLEAWSKFAAVCDAHKLYDCAETCYRRAMALTPDDFTFPYLLGYLLDSTGRGGDESIRLYDRAIELNPNYPQAHWRRGVALERLGRPEEARDAYLASTNVDPGLAIGHRNAGQVMLALGEIDDALRRLERAAVLSSYDQAVFAALAQAYRRKGDTDRAREMAQKARTLEPVFDVADPVRNAMRAEAVDSVTLYSRGRKLVEEGRYDEALADLLVCVDVDPDNADLHVFLATAFRATGQLGNAKTHATRALQLRPQTVGAHLEMGTILIQSGKLDEGLEQFAEARMLDMNNYAMEAWMADVLLQARHNDQAIEAFERAAKGDALDAKSYWMWGVALEEKDDLAGARDKYEKAINTDPNFAHAYYSLGLIDERLGRRKEAIEHYRAAIRIEPRHPAAQRLRTLEPGQP